MRAQSIVLHNSDKKQAENVAAASSVRAQLRPRSPHARRQKPRPEAETQAARVQGSTTGRLERRQGHRGEAVSFRRKPHHCVGGRHPRARCRSTGAAQGSPVSLPLSGSRLLAVAESERRQLVRRRQLERRQLGRRQRGSRASSRPPQRRHRASTSRRACTIVGAERSYRRYASSCRRRITSQLNRFSQIWEHRSWPV